MGKMCSREITDFEFVNVNMGYIFGLITLTIDFLKSRMHILLLTSTNTQRNMLDNEGIYLQISISGACDQ